MRFHDVEIALITIYGLVVICGTLGNGLVIKWFVIGEERKKPGNKLVVVLAINDFLASIFVPLDQIHMITSRALGRPLAWYLGKAMCQSLSGIQLTFLSATPLLLIAISVERFRYDSHIYETLRYFEHGK